jgi:hypothetical protein
MTRFQGQGHQRPGWRGVKGWSWRRGGVGQRQRSEHWRELGAQGGPAAGSSGRCLVPARAVRGGGGRAGWTGGRCRREAIPSTLAQASGGMPPLSPKALGKGVQARGHKDKEAGRRLRRAAIKKAREVTTTRAFQPTELSSCLLRHPIETGAAGSIPAGSEGASLRFGGRQ